MEYWRANGQGRTEATPVAKALSEFLKASGLAESLANRAIRDTWTETVGSEVCQYENTSNGDFLIDRHPELENVWLAGGGSGHGFKHGPALGEYLAARIVGGGPAEARFSLATKQKIQERTVY